MGKLIPGIVMDYENVGNSLIWFNVTKPPFDNKKVRQAVAYALDKKEILKAVFWGLGEPLNHQPFQEGSRFYIPIEDRAQDLAKAKQLLAEAGYPNGFKTEFFIFSYTLDVAGTEVAVGQLKKIGIDASIRVIDRAPYYVAVRKGDYNITLRGIPERLDWDDAFYMVFHSNELGKNNFSRYSNKQLDGLLAKGRATWKMEDRVPVYKKVMEILKEDVPAIYLYKNVVGAGMRDYLKGYRKGFSVRLNWYKGGAKYWWLDK